MFASPTMELRLLASAAALAGIALAAAPQTAASGLSDRVQIALQGRIEPRCSFAGIASVLDMGAISGTSPARKELSFVLSCNAPFGYRLSAANGEMRGAGTGSGQGTLNHFPYRAELSIATDGGAALRLSCASEELLAGALCEGQSGNETATDRDAVLAVSWGPIAGMLAAGHYSDHIEIAVNVAN